MKRKVEIPKGIRDQEYIDRLIEKLSNGAEPFEYGVVADEKAARTRSRQSTTTGISTFTGEWNSNTVLHLLKRTLFGVKQAELEQFEQMSMSEAINQLIQTSPDPARPINDYGYDDVQDPSVAPGESWVEAPYNVDYEGYRIMSLNGWLLQNMVSQELTIHEKMLVFWHNLLPTQSFGVFIAKTSFAYFAMLRRNALGNFKTMIKELTLDPCMLFYLNGAWNNKWAPDENYSRELQELFTLGKGPNSRYTEADVQAGARLLTGFTSDWDKNTEEGPMTSYFRSEWHDTEDKQFSEFFGNRVIQGRSGEAGAEELDDMLDMIFDNNETAMYICRRLYNFFIYSEIDESVESNVIAPLAQIFRDNNYEIAPVLEVLFSCEHFYDEANMGAMIKNPLDHLLGFWRTTGVEHIDENDEHLKYETWLSTYWGYLNGTGMRIGDPPSVSGWPAYYQAPSFDKSWITTDSVTKRALYIDGLIYGWYWVNDDDRLQVNLMDFVSELPNPSDPNDLISDAAKLLHGIPMSEDSRAYLKSILLSGREDGYWTVAWLEYSSDPENPDYRSVVESRLQHTFRAMCQLGEFQLM